MQEEMDRLKEQNSVFRIEVNSKMFMFHYFYDDPIFSLQEECYD